MMLFYSFALAVVLTLASPLWGWRMLRQHRYRDGVAQRLGFVPLRLARYVAGHPVIWVHAVSVGETLTAVRLVAALEAALPGYRIVLSTTTPTGQQVARERFGVDRIFLYPLDFAFAVRAFLKVLQPRLLVLMESEVWPRMLVECERAGVPVAVVNARVSDRSLPRYLALRVLWEPLLAKVSLLLAQSEQDEERWVRIGAQPETVCTTGNLKYDLTAAPDSPLAGFVRRNLPEGGRVLVAGSTHPGEDALVLHAYAQALQRSKSPSILIVAPRHPQHADEIGAAAADHGLHAVMLSEWRLHERSLPDGEVLLVDSVGELASLYSLACGAFVGGSLVDRGGHNPLEAAQFGVPVAMGSNYANFRPMVQAMLTEDAIVIADGEALVHWFARCLDGDAAAMLVGERGQVFFESQRGATDRTVAALLSLMAKAAGE